MAENAGPLGALLLASVPTALRAGAEDPNALEVQLGEVLGRCRGAWPDLDLPAPVFVRYLAERLQGPGVTAALAAIHAEDLFLCCACAGGDPAAIALFDERVLSQVPSFLASQRPSPAVIDEVRQQLRERLFVAAGDRRPRIAAYTGRGALTGWVRIAAVRTDLNLRRNMDDRLSRREGVEPGELLGAGDPELEYLRRKYQAEFKAAVEDAIAALPAEQRTLLRLHLLNGLSGEQIGALFRISRATAYRRVVEAREAIQEGTRRLLQERLGLSTSEVRSVARLVRSDLNASIARCLADSGAAP